MDSLWTFWLVSNMDLGEFSQYRTWLQIGVPIAFVLTMIFVDEFLAVRALGMLALTGRGTGLIGGFSPPGNPRVCCWSFSRTSGSRSVFFGSACPTFCGIRSTGSPEPATGSAL